MGRLTEQFAEKGLKLREGRWTVWEKNRLNNNLIDFAHEHEEEIGDPTEFATSGNKRAWEVRGLKQELRFYVLYVTRLLIISIYTIPDMFFS